MIALVSKMRKNVKDYIEMPNPNRRRRSKVQNQQHIEAQKHSLSLLSVDGNLQSVYSKVDPTYSRSAEYTEIKIGKPVVIRFLHHSLIFSASSEDEQQIMISTFVKTIEDKKPAAEAITYYSPNVRFQANHKSIKSFGADSFGHELIFYSKSYIGQPLKMTSKVMELDNYDDVFNAISDSTEKLGNIPFFLEYIPYIAVAKSSVSFISKLFKLIDKDDPIIPRLALDLFHNIPNQPRLQSGRFVCIHGTTMTEQEFITQGYKLTHDNNLVDSNNNEYKDSSYFVVQVNSENRSEYEEFEYHQNAAELLAMTNREADLSEFIETAVHGFQTYADISTIKEMEDMQYELDTNDAKEKFKALFKTMSPEVQKLFRNKYIKILNGAEI